MKRHGIKIYASTERCTECQGKCCKDMPGTYHPKDIKGPKRKAIAKMLREGRAAIDWYDGSSNIYYLRPVAGDSNLIFDPSWGGRCQHLTSEGCALRPNERPLGCRTVEVRANRSCYNHSDKKQCAHWWADYQDMLIEIGKEVERQKGHNTRGLKR